MIRQIAWKEWRENRGKYAALWLVFNLPKLAITLMLAVSRAARTPFADLSNQTFMKYLPVPLYVAPTNDHDIPVGDGRRCSRWSCAIPRSCRWTCR